MGTLLLAMGVGVLIGHTNNTTSQPLRASAPAVQVVTVGGGGGGGGGGQSASKAAKKSKHSASTVTTVKISKQTAAKAAAAASKVLGGAAPKNPTVQQGQACSGGAGCQNGQYTGNFFGQ